MRKPFHRPVLTDQDGMAVIGRTLHDLRGIRYEDGPGGNPPAPTPPADPAPPAPPTPPAPPAPTPPADQPPVDFRGDPSQYVRELRDEAKTHRVNWEKEQTAHQEAAQARDALQQQYADLQRQHTLTLLAPALGADPARLLDSSSFMKTFADVDLSKEDDVKTAITTALEKNSAFKAGPALPSSSGGGHTGGSPTTNPTLEGAIARKLGG